MLMQSGAHLDPVENERLLNGINLLQRNSRELQEAVMSIRMTPVAFVFNRFPRVVRDMAQKLDKQVELKMVGENTELDKSFIEKLSDPLTHLVRNSLDHVVRGADLLVSTPRQIWLQQQLGLNTPQYCHLPLLVNQAGEKLSKQTLAPAIDAAFALEALQLALQRLGHFPPEPLDSLSEFWSWAIKNWSLKRVPQAPVVV